MRDREKLVRILDGVGVLAAILFLITWAYGLQIRNWRRAQQMKKAHPAVALAPESLAPLDRDTGAVITLAEFGYAFDMPQAKVETHRVTPAVAAYVFSGGTALSFWNPDAISTTIDTVKDAMGRTDRPFVSFLGARTEYELLASELAVTPDRMLPFMPKAESYRLGLLLSLKSVELRGNPSAIYSLDWAGCRGYELGDPASDRVVDVRCFDRDSREFRFLFAVEPRSNARLDQRQLNRTILSLHRVASETAPEDVPGSSTR